METGKFIRLYDLKIKALRTHIFQQKEKKGEKYENPGTNNIGYFSGRRC